MIRAMIEGLPGVMVRPSSNPCGCLFFCFNKEEIDEKPGRSAAREKAWQLLVKVGISEEEKEYPSRLSGGQQQRLAIARALTMDQGKIVEVGTPAHFFTAPREDRTKLFLKQVL